MEFPHLRHHPAIYDAFIEAIRGVEKDGLDGIYARLVGRVGHRAREILHA